MKTFPLLIEDIRKINLEERHDLTQRLINKIGLNGTRMVDLLRTASMKRYRMKDQWQSQHLNLQGVTIDKRC